MDKQDQPAAGAEAPVEEEDFMPSISLDRYMSSRNRQKSTWVHLTTIIFMLAALVAVFIFKDQCGQSVSNTIFMHSQDESEPLKLQPPALEPPPVPAPKQR